MLLAFLGMAGCTTAPSFPGQSISLNSAVLSLHEQAEAQHKVGEFARAEASLERALRIESNNPYLWFELAQLAHQQDRPQKARDLALRAQSFASGTGRLAGDIRSFLSNLD